MRYLTILLILSIISKVKAQDSIPKLLLQYTGSSTIGNFIKDAGPVYGKAEFRLDTRPESTGGELAILEGRTDLAGIARPPSEHTLGKGVVSTLIGWDAIAVVIHPDNPVQNLTQSQLKGIFTGKIKNWKELGGPDMAITPYIVDVESATRKVFRSAIMGKEDYTACQIVSPDADILERVTENPGGIGHISFSFLKKDSNIKAISVNGQPLSLTNSNYPITRPLYLLWWPGRRDVAAFVNWVTSSEGQRIVMQRFVGTKESSIQLSKKTGTLIVYTETSPVEDGGIFYYPHNPYQVFLPDRTEVLTVPNHLSNNDENPTQIKLIPGNYLIKTKLNNGETEEFFITIEPGETTKVNPFDRKMTPKDKEPVTQNITPENANIQKPLLNPYGDFRVRAEQDFQSSGDRFRGRFRIRAGVNTQISKSSSFDLRVVSTDDPNDPNSTHVNLNSGFNQIRIAIDRAYFSLKPQRLSNFQWWLGKFSNPNLSSNIFSEIVWDDDIQPEGTAFSLRDIPLRRTGKINFINGTYFLSQFQSGARKNWLNTSQVWENWQLSDNWIFTLSTGLYYFANIKGDEITDPVLDANEGNLTYHKMQVNGSDTIFSTHYQNHFYIFDNFILLKYNRLPMPLLFKFQVINNIGASSDKQGYVGGISYGDLQEAQQWKVYYQYHYLQQESVFSPYAQDDTLQKTNTKGHVFGIAYVFHKKISLHAWGLLDKPLDGKGGMQSRFRLDLNVKI